MRRIIPVLVLFLLVAGSPTASASEESNFSGAWYGYDPAPPAGDGSFMTLTIIERGDAFGVQLFDTLASGACDPAAPVRLRGEGTQRSNHLRVAFTRVRCQGATPQIEGALVAFVMQPDGTVVDSFGVVWFRQTI